MPATPTLDAISAVKHKSQPIGEFIEWLTSEGLVIAKHDERDDAFWPADIPTEKLLAMFFNIDLDAADRERRAIIESMSLRELNIAEALAIPEHAPEV